MIADILLTLWIAMNLGVTLAMLIIGAVTFYEDVVSK